MGVLSTKGCLVAGCIKKHYGRGYCKKHLHLVRMYGSPLARKRRERGTGGIGSDGYMIFGEDKKREHIAIAEKALGKPLPAGAEVHHVNGIRTDNVNTNLVICPNRTYHALLHTRQRALTQCGNPDWRKCNLCERYDHVANLNSKSQHRACRNEAARQRYASA